MQLILHWGLNLSVDESGDIYVVRCIVLITFNKYARQALIQTSVVTDTQKHHFATCAYACTSLVLLFRCNSWSNKVCIGLFSAWTQSSQKAAVCRLVSRLCPVSRAVIGSGHLCLSPRCTVRLSPSSCFRPGVPHSRRTLR